MKMLLQIKEVKLSGKCFASFSTIFLNSADLERKVLRPFTPAKL